MIELGIALHWLRSHLWAVGIALGSLIATVLYFVSRKSTPPSAPTYHPELVREQAKHEASVEVLEHQAREDGQVATEEAAQAAPIVQPVGPSVPELEGMTDEELARLFNSRGM
jgi:hypothetical protein